MAITAHTHRRSDRFRRQVQLKWRELEILHGLAVLGKLEAADDQPGLLQPVEVHVEQRPGDPDPAGQLAYVDPTAGQFGHDPHPLRVRDRRQHGEQFRLTSQLRLPSLSPVS